MIVGSEKCVTINDGWESDDKNDEDVTGGKAVGVCSDVNGKIMSSDTEDGGLKDENTNRLEDNNPVEINGTNYEKGRSGNSDEEENGCLNDDPDLTVDNDEPKPPDGGYGWFVVLGLFLGFLLSGGFRKSGGLFFLQFKERFQTGALQAAWPGSLLSLTQSFTAPLVSAIYSRYSIRTTVMIGSALVFVGFLLNSMAVKDFYFLFLSYSVLTGMGLAFIGTPGLYIVSSYFEKHRGFAVSLGTSGGGAGMFIMVPLINFLFENYGFEGAFFILTAIFSHTFVIAMLFRPVSVHHKFLQLTKNRQKIACDVEDSSAVPLTEATAIDIVQSKKSSVDDQLHYRNLNHTIVEKKTRSSENCFCRELKTSLKICFPSEYSSKRKEKKKIFHFNLLKQPTFLLFSISVMLFTMTAIATYTFIPAACVDKGLTKSDAALILSIGGGIETVGRILFGFILDLKRIKPYRSIVYSSYLFFLAGFGLLFPFLQSFASFIIVCSLFGIAFGATVSQRTVILVDMFGNDVLPSCMGLMRLFQGVGMLVGPLFYGALRDATGTYNIAFYIGSGMLLLSGIMMVFSQLIFHVQKRRDEKNLS